MNVFLMKGLAISLLIISTLAQAEIRDTGVGENGVALLSSSAFDKNGVAVDMVNLGGWAGLPAKHAFYFVVTPGDEASKRGECSSTTFFPPDLHYERNGYWSLTLYNEQGWVVTERFNTSSNTAISNEDGSYTLHFNCGNDKINNLQVAKNWNGLFRNYLPTDVPGILKFKDDFITNSPVLRVK